MEADARAMVGPSVGEEGGAGERPLAVVVRHRAHRRPGRGRAVLVRYDDAEHAQVTAAAGRAGLTPAGYVAAAALAAAGEVEPPASAAVRALLVELAAARGQVRRFAVNVNQAVAALHSTGEQPGWLRAAVEGSTRAVRAVDDAARVVARQLG